MKVKRNIVEEILPEYDDDKTIYHYTSPDGLLGMIKSQGIWCTQSYFLNDYEENLNGWKLFLRTFEKYKKSHEHFNNFHQTIKSYFKHWIELDFENLSDEIFKKIEISKYRSFVFSASYKSDDLNQWRSYSPESNGYCIGFKINETFKPSQELFRDYTPEIPTSPNNCKILIKNCIYEDKVKEEICIKLLDYHFQEFLDSGSGSWINYLFFDILTLSLFFKNHKFADEQECRIVVLPVGDKLVDLFKENVNILQFRKGKSMIIPYVQLLFPPTCIESITIGPTPNKYHSKESIEMLISSLIFGKEVSINNSEIPYRAW